jgi:mRNA interferase MazF
LILCQITSNAYSDLRAIELTNSSFKSGSLRVVSYARPAKLFTANRSLLVARVGALKADTLKQIIDAIVELLREATK